MFLDEGRVTVQTAAVVGAESSAPSETPHEVNLCGAMQMSHVKRLISDWLTSTTSELFMLNTSVL